ncbi:MAG: phage portal protein family protein [Planctomycetota bacterium]|jgi:phage gp29-like protein
MKWTDRVVNAVRSKRNGRPKPGRVIAPREEDSVRDYPSVGLTPSRLAAILREADDGSLATAMQLFEEMEEKDAHLFSVANTRRLALTGLDWHVSSLADVREGVDRGLAEEAADYCREILLSLEMFDEALQHLALATGRNISIAEIVWDVAGGELRPVDILPVDFARIMFDGLDQWRILTAEEPQDGIAPAPNKFIAHTPHSVSGHTQRGGLLRVTAMVYLAKNLALKDWMIFAEIFGMPIRIARYEPAATAEEKRELLTMLESLGSHAAGIFSRAVELQVIETNRGKAGPPYQLLIEFLNREMSKAWLGQTLTTDISGQSGSVAASRVHEGVRRDILADDMQKEGRTIRRDLLTPLTRLRFGPDVPVPLFRRKPKPPTDLTDLARVLDVAVNALGMEVPLGWARETLGIPNSSEGEETVPGARS